MPPKRDARLQSIAGRDNNSAETETQQEASKRDPTSQLITRRDYYINNSS